MFGAVTRSMAFERACEREPAAPSSDVAAERVGDVSGSERRPFVSLRGRDSFNRVFQEGSRSEVGPVTVVVAPGRPGPARVGVVAGRQVGAAVARNRAKRRLREAVAMAPPPHGVECLVVAGVGIGLVRHDGLVDMVRKAIDNAMLRMEDR